MTATKTWPKCVCGGIAVDNASGDITRTCIRCGSIIKPLSTPKARLQAMCRRLALAPVRTCKTLHTCTFCAHSIQLGDQYRDKGHGARAHVICFEAVNREVNK
jgi:hypothetical protein